MKKSFFRLILLIAAFPALSGCWYVAAAGAGAAVTYYLNFASKHVFEG